MAGRRKNTHAISRRKRAVLMGVCLVGTAFLIWLDLDVIAPQWLDALPHSAEAVGTDLARYHGRSLPVVRVVDGDTLHLAAPDRAEAVTKVRLLGIDAPEMGTHRSERMYFAEEATAFAERLACDRKVTVYLDERSGSRGRYGRLLAYIELTDGSFLNEQLLLEGYAYADLRFRHSYYQKYQQLEASARSLRAGLWAEVKTDQLPPWLQRMRPELRLGR